jgi:predicted transcriptional regulator
LAHQELPQTSRDRRRRHAGDPMVAISIELPVRLQEALDDLVVARGGTRSGFIRIAIAEWVAREQAKEIATDR